MRNRLRHIVQLISVWLLIGMPAACSTETDSSPESLTGDGTVMLVVNTGLIGSTRSGSGSGSDAWPENEKMKTLRIVVLHTDGTVEHNLFLHFGENPQTEYGKQVIKVKPNEKKFIYLIANEESVNGLANRELDAFVKDAPGFKDRVETLSFIPAYTTVSSSPLPMSATYELEVKDESQECQFYLVRAATKFTFRFNNMRGEVLTVNSISVSDISESMYLMPNKQNPQMKFSETDGSESELYWIDWLKRVSDESQAHPDDKGLADRRGWIMDYDIPQQTSRTVTVEAPQDFQLPAATYDMGVPKPSTTVFPAFYLPESKHLKTQQDSYGEQEYTMTLRFTDGKKEEKIFNSTFDNLKALFRNTHVVVDVTLGDKGISVDVIPYSEVILKPEFGLTIK